MIMEPREQGFSNELVATSMYGDLQLGSCSVKIWLQNLTSTKQSFLPVCHGPGKANNAVLAMYAPVTPKGCLITGAAIPNNDNLLSPAPTTGCEEEFGWSPVNTKPEVPAPFRTILKQTDLLGCTLWSPEDCQEAVVST